MGASQIRHFLLNARSVGTVAAGAVFHSQRVQVERVKKPSLDAGVQDHENYRRCHRCRFIDSFNRGAGDCCSCPIHQHACASRFHRRNAAGRGSACCSGGRCSATERKKLACQAASEAMKGQARKDQMQLCMLQARLDCLKQAIDQNIVGPQRADFVKSCTG